MSIELLGQYIEREKELIERISEFSNKSAEIDKGAIDSLVLQLKTVNRVIPDILSRLSFYKTLKNGTQLDTLDYRESEKSFSNNNSVSKKNFFKNSDKDEAVKFSSYIKLSNRVFRNISDKMVKKGYFDLLKADLRKITFPLIINSYVAVMLFTTLLSFGLSLIISSVMFIFGLGIGFSLAVLLLPPLAVFISFYFYPFSRRHSLEKEINQELPFLTIYMAAISTAGIEPSKIFDILVESKDYPYSQREIKKLNNLLNFYGYDLVSALRIASKSCPSERLALLFDGLATTITSGSELTAFLNKHAETLMFDYRLEREKYTRVAETFMNIYISIVIAAPMIMMMLLILMSLTGFAAAYLSPTNIGLLAILIISLSNIAFLIFLNMKQPKF